MMNKRTQVQKEASQCILDKKDLIVFCSLRLGKTRISLMAIEEDDKVLICYPNIAIKDSFEQELTKFTPKSTNITYTTKDSLKKFKNQYFDYIIIDEPQLLSLAQINHLKTITYKKRVGLSGTLNPKTIKRLDEKLGLKIGFSYTIEEAISDGIVKDYQVNIVFEDLNDIVKAGTYKKFKTIRAGTEKEIYDSYTTTMNYFSQKYEETGDTKYNLGYRKYMGLRTNFLYNSFTLLILAKKLIDKYKDEKCLIYTMRTDIADNLSKESFHSKNKSSVLDKFKESNEGHLSTVNCISTGVTIANLNKVIFHSTESNEEKLYQKLGRSLLHRYKGEKAEIFICCLKDTQMETWIKRATKSLDQNKINYIYKDKSYNKLEWIKFNNPSKILYDYNGSICYKGDSLYYFVDNPYTGYPLNIEKLTLIN